VRGRQQQAGGQAHDRDTEPPRRAPTDPGRVSAGRGAV
jgi:hypothetical protein